MGLVRGLRNTKSLTKQQTVGTNGLILSAISCKFSVLGDEFTQFNSWAEDICYLDFCSAFTRYEAIPLSGSYLIMFVKLMGNRHPTTAQEAGRESHPEPSWAGVNHLHSVVQHHAAHSSEFKNLFSSAHCNFKSPWTHFPVKTGLSNIRTPPLSPRQQLRQSVTSSHSHRLSQKVRVFTKPPANSPRRRVQRRSRVIWARQRQMKAERESGAVTLVSG